MTLKQKSKVESLLREREKTLEKRMDKLRNDLHALRKKRASIEAERLEAEKAQFYAEGKVKKSKIHSSAHEAKVRKEKSREVLENEFENIVGRSSR